MHAVGSDHLQLDESRGLLILSSRTPKPWYGRREKTRTSPEHPGTAILWQEEWYEVVEVDRSPDGRVRYTLAAWKDEHAIRTADRYDEQSEADRVVRARESSRRETYRRLGNLHGLIVGHFPAPVQEAIGSELGILPTRLTLLSMVLPIVVLFLTFEPMVRGAFPGPPAWQRLSAYYLTAETVLRFSYVMTQSRALGSPAGSLLYRVSRALGRRWRTGARRSP